jgi:hypothetical protein
MTSKTSLIDYKVVIITRMVLATLNKDEECWGFGIYVVVITTLLRPKVLAL